MDEKQVQNFKEAFAEAHVNRYGKRVLKTAWHFMHWASGYDGNVASRRFTRFEKWCVRHGKPRTTDNAIRWYLKYEY